MLIHTNEFRRTIKLLQLLRKHVHEDLTVKQAVTLLTIATEPEIDQTTLGAKSDISRATTSKNIADLSSLTSRKKIGPGVVENTIDAMRLNIRLPRLTRKGETVLSKIAIEAWGAT